MTSLAAANRSLVAVRTISPVASFSPSRSISAPPLLLLCASSTCVPCDNFLFPLMFVCARVLGPVPTAAVRPAEFTCGNPFVFISSIQVWPIRFIDVSIVKNCHWLTGWLAVHDNLVGACTCTSRPGWLTRAKHGSTRHAVFVAFVCELPLPRAAGAAPGNDLNSNCKSDFKLKAHAVRRRWG